MYDRRKFATEDDIGMSKQVLSNEKYCFLFENYRYCAAFSTVRKYEKQV